MRDNDIDVEWIGYHTIVRDVIHPTIVVTTPYDINVTYLEWYYRVSHPRLVSPRQDAPREVPIHVYEAGPSYLS